MLPNVRVKILRGDDSYFLKGKKEKREENDLKIQDEEDLFNDTVLSEDSSLEENTKRLIKTDNIVSISYGTMAGVDINSDSTSYTLLNGAWAYQLADNVWGEARYGQTIIRDFPNLELDTTLTNFVASLKYTVEAPFDSYIQPYIGYQVVQASSPLAETEDEEALLDLSKSSKPVFGVTLLKRFVPAWFIKANLGSDLVSVGMALEF